MQTLAFKEERVKMINYKQYVENAIEVFSNEMGVQKDENFNAETLEKNLETEIHPIVEAFKFQLKEISQEIFPILNSTLKVPNRTVGQEIDTAITSIDFPLQKGDTFYFTQLEGIEKTEGLNWDKEKQKIVGKATKAGDFTLIADGVFHSSRGYKQKIKSTFRLTIIPDPRSLWKNLEPNENLPYPKSHEDSDSLQTEESAILLYASKRGRSHAHVGSFRDDDGKIITSPSGWSILGVADGAGSCSLSREGSRIAIYTAVDILVELLSSKNGEELEKLFLENRVNSSKELEEEIEKKLEGTIVTGAYHALKKIHETAHSIERSTKDFSTTLLLTAHKKLEQGHLILSFWVGDGVIAIYKQGEKVEILGEPDSGEFAGQTRFLSNDIFDKENIKRRTSILLVEDFTALVLATDGISDPFFSTDEDLKEIKEWDKFWNKISTAIDSKEKLLAWLDFWSVGNHDDRSIALLLPPKEEETKEIKE